MTNDVSALAGGGWSLPFNPTGGVSTYDSFAPPADPNTIEGAATLTLGPGWNVLVGTSIAAPIIAAIFALAGNARTNDGFYARGPYSVYRHSSHLFDVTSGNNGDGKTPTSTGFPFDFTLANCGNYMCKAGPGYDGPTGNGTPNGIGAF